MTLANPKKNKIHSIQSQTVNSGNLSPQQLTQSPKPSAGHAATHSVRLLPSLEPLHDDPPPHRCWHVATHGGKASAAEGQNPMQAARLPPGQLEGVGLGEGVGIGAGIGVAGVGTGLQRLGSGPCTTLPLTRRFFISYTEA